MKRNTLLSIVVCVVVLGAGALYATFSAPTTPPPVTQEPPKATPPVQQTPVEQKPVDPNLPTPSHSVLTSCTTDMATQFHIHQHLVLLVNKEPQTIPSNIGIDIPKNCMSPIHTHAVGGIIHVESPQKVDFVLGDFFYNWGKPFNKNQVGDFKVDKDHGLKMYINGKESTDFEKLILQEHQEIVVVYYALKDGPGTLPPPFDWTGF